MVGEGEADRAGGDHAGAPITLLGVGAMAVLVGGGGDGVRGRRVAEPDAIVERLRDGGVERAPGAVPVPVGDRTPPGRGRPV